MSSIIGGTTGITFPDSTVQTTAATTPTAVANLSGGAAGVVPYQTGSGATSFTAAGTSGQVLTSAGTGTPTWSTPSAGAMTLISTQTVSSATSIQWTGLNTYSNYLIILKSLQWTTNTNQYVQFGTAGPTWNTSNYSYTILLQNPASNTMTSIGVNYGNGSGVSIAPATYLPSDPDGPSVGQIFISNLKSTTSTDIKGVTFQVGIQVGTINIWNCSGTGVLTGDTNSYSAIRIVSASGTMTGSASLYGISS